MPQVTPNYHQYLSDIEDCAAKGMTYMDIGDYLCLTSSQFRRWCKLYPEVMAAYRRGRAKAKVYVVGKLFTLIEEGNVAATIFYLKTRCGWRETGTIKDDLQDFDNTPQPLSEESQARIKALIRESAEEFRAIDTVRATEDT